MIEKWTFEQFVQLGLGLEEDLTLTPDPSPFQGEGSDSYMRKETARRAFEARMGTIETEEEWLEDYLMLREAGWPWEKAVYVAWEASPKATRMPRTIDELATKYIGLTTARRIYIWKRKNPAMEDAIAMLSAAPLLKHRRDIYEALIAVATDPDYKGHQDRKLALELLGDYTPRSDQNIRVSGSFGDLSELSEEELARLAGGTADKPQIATKEQSTQITQMDSRQVHAGMTDGAGNAGMTEEEGDE